MFKWLKNYNKKVVSISCLVFGAIMFTISFFMPPQGVIDNSVIEAVGILLLYASTIDGLDILKSKFGRNKEKEDFE